MAEYKETHDLVGIQITTSKLNGKNFLLLKKSVWVFLGAKDKLKIVTFTKSASTKKAFEEWECDNYLEMTLPWNNMESTVIANFIFLDIAKKFGKLFLILLIQRVRMLLEFLKCMRNNLVSDKSTRLQKTSTATSKI